MTNLTPVIIGLSMVGVFAAVLGFIFYRIGEKKKAAAAALAKAIADAPTTWKHIGVPPPMDVDVALRIIGAKLPLLRDRGTIEWVEGPFDITGWRVAGLMVSATPCHVKVTCYPWVEDTALAHELGHVDQRLRGLKDCPEPSADPVFAQWIRDTNLEIKKALGRAR
jgi:hypothetical protein